MPQRQSSGPAPSLRALPDDTSPPPLAEVYRDHVDFVVKVTRQLGVPDAQTEDVVHDVFLVVHRRLSDYDGRAPMRSWLYGITRRVVMRHQRGRTRERARQVHAPIPLPIPAADERVERHEAAAAVQRCLAALDDDQQMVFVLAELEGMTAPEIAAAHRIKLNTVYSRLRLARKKFERALQELRGRDAGGARR